MTTTSSNPVPPQDHPPKLTIQVFEATDGRWAYAPLAVRYSFAFNCEGQFDTAEQALAAAQADRSIPQGTPIVLEEPAPDEIAELGEAESYEHDLMELVRAARALVNSSPRDTDFAALAAALDQFEPWLEQAETPESMGWVGKDGRP